MTARLPYSAPQVEAEAPLNVAISLAEHAPDAEMPTSAWTMHVGDCLEGMKSLPDASVDHVITDPPFTQRTSQNMRSRRDPSDGGSYVGDSKRRRIEFDGVDGLEAIIAHECLRVAKRWCVIFCAIEQIGVYAEAANECWVRGTVWHRTNSAPQFTGDRPGQSCEGIAILHRPGRKRWNRGGHSLLYTGPTINATNDTDRGRFDHPTVKPVWLMESLVRDFTDRGDLILDPFAGSGTTGVAAIRLGRSFLGWEINPKYAEIARRRLSMAREQFDLFSTEATP